MVRPDMKWLSCLAHDAHENAQASFPMYSLSSGYQPITGSGQGEPRDETFPLLCRLSILFFRLCPLCLSCSFFCPFTLFSLVVCVCGSAFVGAPYFPVGCLSYVDPDLLQSSCTNIYSLADRQETHTYTGTHLHVHTHTCTLTHTHTHKPLLKNKLNFIAIKTHTHFFQW